MTDVMSVQKRSRVMSRIRGKDTAPERRMAELLTAAGLAFERHSPDIAGKPDFVFLEHRLVVFVDGDFWHGWRFPTWQHRLQEFWKDKIAQNRERDDRNFRRLRRAGWTVLRIWEHEVESDARECVLRIANLIGTQVSEAKIEERLASLPKMKRRNRLPKP